MRVASVIVAFAWMAPDSARAQETVNPYVLLLVDNSGSMAWGACSSAFANVDASAECTPSSCDVPCSGAGSCPGVEGCGDGLCDDSRLWKVKVGMSEVISAFGEIEFGLARFPRQQHRSRFNGCSGGGWTPRTDTCPGSGGACTSTIGTGLNGADILVGIRPDNQADLLDWMDGCDDYPTNGYWTPSGGAVNCGTPDAPVTGCDLCTDPGASCDVSCDKELRATGSTPLAGGVKMARDYLEMVRAGDARGGCRPYEIVLLTDGQEYCCQGESPPAQEAQAQATCATGIRMHAIGFADSTIYCSLKNIQRAACGMVCSSADSACENDCASVWAYPPGGSPCGCTEADPEPLLVDNETDLATGIADVLSSAILTETCNGVDDNCNGVVDEGYGVGTACDNGLLGACFATGHRICDSTGRGTTCDAPRPSGTPEVCNNVDDDCNGAIDEGLSCTPCAPQPEVCNGRDDNCNGAVDEGFVSGACGLGVGACRAGTTSCVGGAVVCVGATDPSPEICDCVDNNCDGVVDGLERSCYSHASGCDPSTGECTGVCRFGTQTCTTATCPAWSLCAGDVGPSPEVCNLLDDDCNGLVDDGGVCSTCSPEVCDGVDNDCNGVVDDLPPRFCGSDVGECAAGGLECVGVGGVEVCVGAIGPSPEACDGLDNDCDGVVDNGAIGEGAPCGGGCVPGSTVCAGGMLACVGGEPPASEECNGIDDNCDGRIDETFPESGLPCAGEGGCAGRTVCDAGVLRCDAPAPMPEVCNGLDDNCNGSIDEGIGVGTPCGTAAGACAQGTLECVDGAAVCIGAVTPAPERCNGMDDNCDGLVDNGATCPPPARCLSGACVTPCAGGEFSCPGGLTCQSCELPSGCCVPDACTGVSCGIDERCAVGPSGPSCVPRCQGVTCDETHEICLSGMCVDDSCATRGCPSGRVCIDYACVANRCAGGACPDGQFCRDGACVPTCQGVHCDGGQMCRDGACAPDPCAGVRCGANEACVEGTCLPDPCMFTSCSVGEVCVAGEGCRRDACLTISCPGGACVGDQCVGAAQPPRVRHLEVAAHGGCAVGGGDVGAAWALVALIVARRRRPS